MHTDILYDKVLTYKASLLRTCTKLYKETAITVNDLTVHKIKQRAMNSQIMEIEEIFPREFDNELEPLDDVLEKLAMLTHIMNREFQQYLFELPDEEELF